MGVGRQSRRVCFGAKPDKGFLDKKISPYPEVVRGRERELTTRPRERQLVAGPERGVAAGQERGEQQKLAAGQREARQHGIGSSESESR